MIFRKILYTSLLLYASGLVLALEPKQDAKKTNKQDYLFAVSLQKIYKQLIKKRLAPKVVSQAAVNAGKSSLFQIYSPLLSELKTIASKRELSLLVRSCDKMGQFETMTNRPIFNKIMRLSGHYCIHKYLRLKTKTKKSITVFSSSEKEFINKNLASILSKKHKKSLMAFLGKIKKDSLAQIFISEIITYFYMNLNEIPDRKIVALLKIDEHLTSYIQLKGLVDKSTIKFFKSEFRKLYKDTLKSIDNKKESDIQKSIDYIIGFYSTNKHYLPPGLAIDYLKTILKKLIFKNKYSLADDFSKAQIPLVSYSNKNEAIFFRIWTLLRISKPKEALKTIKKYRLLKKFDNLDNKLRYWIATALKQSGQQKQAKKYFEIQIDLAPVSYYSILAFKELQNFSKEITPDELFIPHTKWKYYYEQNTNDIYQNTIARLDTWIKINNNPFIVSEIKHFLKKERLRLTNNRYMASAASPQNTASEKNNPTIKMINYLHQKRKFLTSFKVLYNSIDQNIININNQVIKFLFPVQYIDIIKKFDKVINPLLILSLIRQESAFDPTAKSIAGARGLMQLMPSTAKRFVSRISRRRLKRPKTNIRIGVQLLRKLLKKYNGNLVYALSAYNAGEGNVDKWIKQRFSGQSFEDIIEEIPYKETRLYVKLIYRNLFFYNMLSGNKDFFSKELQNTFYSTTR